MLPHRIDYKTALVESEGLHGLSLKQRGAALPLLPLPAPGPDSREGWLGACALVSSSQKYLEAEGRRSKTTRQEDVHIDETEVPEHYRSPTGAYLHFTHTDSSLICKPRCPNPHLAGSSGPLYGWHLWLLLWCSWYFLLRTLLLLLPRTKDLQSAGSGRTSWRGR